MSSSHSSPKPCLWCKRRSPKPLRTTRSSEPAWTPRRVRTCFVSLARFSVELAAVKHRVSGDLVDSTTGKPVHATLTVQNGWKGNSLVEIDGECVGYVYRDKWTNMDVSADGGRQRTQSQSESPSTRSSSPHTWTTSLSRPSSSSLTSSVWRPCTPSSKPRCR
jgi:hypothetical protein